MTDDEQIRRALWALVKEHKNQANMCKVLGIKCHGHFNRILSGRREPTDRFCRMVGWKKVALGKYEKL